MRFLTKFFSLLLAANIAYAAELSVGVVDVEKLLKEAPQVEKINEKMLARFGGKKDELVNLEGEIKKMQENFKRNELVMTEDKLNEMRQEIIAKVQLYKQNEAVLQQEVATMRAQEVAELQTAIRSVIDELAATGKYDLILSDGVLHAKDNLDITDTVLGKMKKLIK